MPELDNFKPTIGPAAGGSNLTLHGENLHLGDNITVRLNGTVGPSTVIK